MKKLLSILLAFLPIVLFSQSNYEKYLIAKEKEDSIKQSKVFVYSRAGVNESISKTEAEQRQRLSTRNYKSFVQFGIGVDFVMGQHFPETDDYVQVYGDKEGNVTTTRPVIDFFTVMKSPTPNRAMNIPVFMKINIGKNVHIIPTISVPIFSIGRGNVQIKSIKDKPLWEVRTHRGEAGNRGWDYGSDIHIFDKPYWLADTKLNMWRIGGYLTQSNESTWCDSWDIGIGLFYDIRKYEVFQWEYSADYNYSYIDYSTSEYVYHRSELDVWNAYYAMSRKDMREDAIKVDKVTTKSIEIPIYFSIGWEQFRLKTECAFTKGDVYGTLGLEFIFN